MPECGNSRPDQKWNENLEETKSVIADQVDGLSFELQSKPKTGQEKKEWHGKTRGLIQKCRKVGQGNIISRSIKLFHPEMDAMRHHHGYAGDDTEEFAVLFRQHELGRWIQGLDKASKCRLEPGSEKFPSPQ